MTCIAGIEHRGRVWIGGDSALSWGDARTTPREPKVRRVSGIIIGTSGAMRSSDLALSWRPPRYDGSDPYRFAVDQLAPSLIKHFRAAKATPSSNFEILAGIGGTLLTMTGTGGAHTWPHGYGATGCGSDWALGSLGTSARVRPMPTPATRIRWALELSAEHCSAVAPPWRILSSA